jgi:4'-phosphopantetheinyl transferase
MAPVYVWWARRQDASPRLEALLDDVARGRWTAYRRTEDRDRFLVGNALVKCAVADRTGKRSADVIIDRTCPDCGKPHGKPVVPGLELSVTHSGDLVGVAVATVPVGLDVEHAESRRDDVEGLARYALSDGEQSALAALPAADRKAGFFVYWTRKEAVTKATGDGLRASFQEVVVSAPGEPPRLLGWPYPAAPSVVTLADLAAEPDYEPDYAAALAVIGESDGVIVRDGTALLAENIGRL